MTKFRKGDVVSIEVTVGANYIHDGKIKVMAGGYNEFYAETSSLTMVRSDIKVGDTVALKDDILDDHRGEVLAVQYDHLWVSLGEGAFGTWWIDKVVRVDPVEAEEPAVDPAELAVA